MQLTGQFSSAVLVLFFCLLNQKLRAGRSLVKQLLELDSAAR